MPKRLSEEDRHTLARYFGISEVELGGPGHDRSDLSQASSTLIPVPRLNVDASAGPGAFNDSESGFAHIGFDEKWLRRVSRSKSSDLSVIKVQGDSMTPTLSDGDDILVDAGDGVERLRDGIYVLRRDDALLVKRIAPSPASRRIIIESDNDSYPSSPAKLTLPIRFGSTTLFAEQAESQDLTDRFPWAMCASSAAEREDGHKPIRCCP